MINLHRNLIVRRELWFDEEWNRDGADLIVFYHWSQPINASDSQEVTSLEIDLAADQASIWNNFTSTARNLVNRGIKEGLSFQRWSDPSPDVIAEFITFQSQSAIDSEKASAAPVWMYEYARQSALMLTVARDRDGKALVWHSYYKDPLWVRLLHSVSRLSNADPEERKTIGWGNRYLHWADIQGCRDSGVKSYDFGGWYAGGTDEKLLGINAFKEQFGGRRTVRYHSMLPVTAKGKLFLQARATLKNDRTLVHFV